MLIEFSVKNFLSFRNKVTLSMERGNGDENIDNIFNINDNELLKTCSIYGANASGKSNILKALTCAILMVRQSNIIPVGVKWINLKPFMFDDTLINDPSEFEFVILLDGTKYKYSFSAMNDRIIDESLEAYYSQKSTMIFSRTNTSEYKFLLTDDSKLKSLESKNTDNKLFLATASNWNYDKTKDVYLWFLNSIDTYDSFDAINRDDLINLSKGEESLKKFTLKLLKEADIVINDFNVDYEEKDMDTAMAEMYIPPVARTNGIPKISSVRIETFHEVTDENNNKKVYSLNMEDESSGTKILFALAPFLKKAFETTKVIVVDELEKSLHPTLVEYLIKIFNNKKINKSNSQLIFTTHAVNLLNLDLFRRDQIYFVEKDPKNGVSDLYPLDAFSVRKGENVQKGYINGRYGAIPFIRDIDLWEDNVE